MLHRHPEDLMLLGFGLNGSARVLGYRDRDACDLITDRSEWAADRSIVFWYGLLKEKKNEESSVCAGWSGSVDEHGLLPAEAPLLLGFGPDGPAHLPEHVHNHQHLMPGCNGHPTRL